METWLKTCLLLCSYGFFKELRPSESFLTEYLLSPHKNFTEHQVNYEIYPVWPYSYLSLLIIVFLVTDLLRYKPVIVLEGVSYVATWSLLLWATGLRWMQFTEFMYGVVTSTEVAYFTYIYAQVDSCHYQKVTSYTRSAILFGRFMSGVLGQVFYSTGLLDYYTLNYVSLASVTVALGIACLLPKVDTSIYFHRRGTEEEVRTQAEAIDGNGPGVKTTKFVGQEKLWTEEAKTLSSHKFKQALRLFWQHFRDAYSQTYLLKWSIWWSFATAIDLQVGLYLQSLWESIPSSEDTEDNLYNGAADAASTFLGAVAAFGVGYLRLNWTVVGEPVLAVISLLDSLVLMLMGVTSQIWIGYVGSVAFRVSYQVLITIVSYQVAKNLSKDSYGLIFGINTFVAVFIQTLVTLIVLQWFQMEPGLQFVIYGCYFGFLSFIFFVFSSYNLGLLGKEGILRQGLCIKVVDC